MNGFMDIDKILEEMRQVFKEIPYGVEHTLKVLSNAEEIMRGENLKEEEQELISIVAILHDIGAVEALHKYGSIEGVYQEKEGPAVARSILEKTGYEPNKIQRVCYIIGNHHTPSKIDGLDFQIQWEADLIENLVGTDDKDKQTLQAIIDKNFKTAAGKALAYQSIFPNSNEK
jgi:urease accessory protein UreE